MIDSTHEIQSIHRSVHPIPNQRNLRNHKIGIVSIILIIVLNFFSAFFLGCENQISAENPKNSAVQSPDDESDDKSLSLKEYLSKHSGDSFTQTEFNSIRHAWIIRNTIPYFTQFNDKEDHHFEQAEIFLREALSIYANRTHDMSYSAIKKMGWDLIESGYDSPLVLLWLCQMIANSEPWDYGTIHKMNKLAYQALKGLEQSEYPPIQLFYATTIIKVLYRNAFHITDQEIDRINELNWNALVHAVQTGCFQDKEWPIAYRIPERVFRNEDWIHFFKLIKDRKDLDPWLYKMYSGSYEVALAWKARGSGYAKKVTQTGWKNFADHLAQAREVFTEAWQLKPNQPDAAAQMVAVAMGDNKNRPYDERKWFQRAVAAQIDFAAAYKLLIYAMEPKWGGSWNQMVAFGEECLETDRFDTDIPLYYLTALRNIGGDMTHDNWRSVFKDSEVQKNLNYMFDNALNNDDGSIRHNKILTLKALAELWQGNYFNADELLGRIDPETNFYKGFWGTSLGWNHAGRDKAEAELRAFTGPYKEILIQAEKNNLEGNFGEAAQLFSDVMKKYPTDDEIFSYLRRRSALTHMDLESGKISANISALYYAAKYGYTETAKFLVENGAQLNSQDPRGDTPLSIAVCKGHNPIARLLVEQGADPNLPNNKNNLPLHLAIRYNSESMANFLIEKGSRLNHLSIDGWSPLNFACLYNRPSTAILLIHKGADVDQTNSDGWSPLHLAIQYCSESVVKLLIEKGADVGALSKTEVTPLHLAVLGGFPKAVEMLLDNGADINTIWPGYGTSADIAKSQNNVQILNILTASAGN